MKWSAPAGGSGLTLITSGSFSSSSEFNVGTVFSSTYRNYKIYFDITARSGNVNLRCKFNDNSNNNGRRVTITDVQTVTQYSADFQLGTIDNSIGSVEMTLFAPYATEYTKLIAHTTCSANNTFTGGVKEENTSFTTIVFYVVSGNISGNYRVYGLANS